MLESAEPETGNPNERVIYIDNIVSGGADVIQKIGRFCCRHRVTHILAPCKETAAVKIKERRTIDISVFIGISYVEKAIRIFAIIINFADKILSVVFLSVMGS